MVKTTRLIPDTVTAENDSKIEAAIQATFKGALGDTDSVQTIGVRNTEGVVYREVQINSLDQIASLTNRLHKLGFTIEMDEEGGMIDGYDATFRSR